MTLLIEVFVSHCNVLQTIEQNQIIVRWNKLVYDGTELKSDEELVARIAVTARIIRDNAASSFGQMRALLINRLHLCLRDDIHRGTSEQ